MKRADFLRVSYCLIVRMHPGPFRNRFGDEMVWIFDEERGRGKGARLFFDGIVSLLRQRSKMEATPAPMVAGFGLLDTGWGIAPRRFVEAGIMASLVLAGFMLLLGKAGEPFTLPACVPGTPRAAPPRIQAPSRISAVPIAAQSHGRVDSGPIDHAVTSAVRMVHAQEATRFCSED
jgi:hypothetical protein